MLHLLTYLICYNLIWIKNRHYEMLEYIFNVVSFTWFVKKFLFQNKALSLPNNMNGFFWHYSHFINDYSSDYANVLRRMSNVRIPISDSLRVFTRLISSFGQIFWFPSAFLLRLLTWTWFCAIFCHGTQNVQSED